MVTQLFQKTYHFNMKYKMLIPNQEELINEFPPQLKALGSFTSTSKAVTECKKLLSKITERCDLMLLRVPGHIGIDENEKNDELARTESDSEFNGPETAVGIYILDTSEVKSLRIDAIHIWRFIKASGLEMYESRFGGYVMGPHRSPELSPPFFLFFLTIISALKQSNKLFIICR